MTSLPTYKIRGSMAFGASFASHVRRLVPGYGSARYGVLDGHEVLVATTEVPLGGKEQPRTTFAVQLSPPLFMQLLVHPRGGPTFLVPHPVEPLQGVLTGDLAWDEAHYVTAAEEQRALMLLSAELRAGMQNVLAAHVSGPRDLAINDTMVGITLVGAAFQESWSTQLLRGLIACAGLLGARARQIPRAESLVLLSNEWAAYASDRHMTFDAERMHMHGAFPTWSLDVMLEPTPRCVYVAVTARLSSSVDVAFELHEGHMGWLARKLDHAVTTGDQEIDEHYVVHADAKDRVRQILGLPAVHALLLHHDAEVSLSSSHVFLRVPGLDPSAAVEQVTAAANAMMGTNANVDRPYR